MLNAVEIEINAMIATVVAPEVLHMAINQPFVDKARAIKVWADDFNDHEMTARLDQIAPWECLV